MKYCKYNKQDEDIRQSTSWNNNRLQTINIGYLKSKTCLRKETDIDLK